MSSQQLQFYEQKIISDKEFPIEVFMNQVQDKCQYFHTHWHEHIELHYVVHGETDILLNQTRYTFRQGDLAVINSNVLHAGFCNGTPVEVLVVIFELDELSAQVAEKNILFQPMICADTKIQELMSLIYQEQNERSLGWKLACKGALLQLIAYLERRYTEQMLTDKESLKRRKNLERLNTVVHYIEENYTDSISNAQLAELIHVSEDRFNHLFRESMGMAPLQYMNEVRLKKAMHLLKSGNYSAAEVADAVGFSDYNHFGRLFRRYYQCTPMEAVRESEGKSAKRPGRSEGIKTFEIGSIKKEDPVDVKSEKEKKK